MTPAELLNLAHGGSDQAFDALQESLPLRQDPVKWDIFDQSTYPPLVCENGAEADMVNGVVPPQKRKRRGRSAKTSAHPPVDDAISPHSGGNDNAKRMRLGSPIGEISIPMADSRSSPKPLASDDIFVHLPGGLINEVVVNTQTVNKLVEQVRDIYHELNEVLKTLDAPLKRLQDVRTDIQVISNVQSEVRRIAAVLNGA